MADAKRIKWTELVKGLRNVEVGKPLDLEVQRETIPIVFVPGIMGSRLKKDGKKVWDPDGSAFMLWKYGMAWVGPADKKRALIGKDFRPGDLVPLEDDAEHNQKFASVPGAAKRGWGTVAWGTYGEILLKLQDPETWPPPMRAFFDLPVYAVGYNWAASNEHSGGALAKKIDQIVKYHAKEGGLCRKVIVVTHSMGGLVARWASEESGAASKILGIVHGVQPAVGAAAAYWRMKAGFERDRLFGQELPSPAAWVLGTNGREVTALLGWMPGGMQLLPGPSYEDNGHSKQWLTFRDHQGREQRALPESDAYEEIYKNDDPEAYWRLVNAEYLLPGDKPGMSPEAAWDSYGEKVDAAKIFHEDVAGKVHAETQAFYGAGRRFPTTDRILFELVPHDWKAVAKDVGPAAALAAARWALFGPASAGAYVAFQAFKRTEWWQSRGAFKLRIETEEGDVDVEMQHPHALTKLDENPHGAGAGDGTVPESSGKALKQRGDAVGSEQEARAFQGISHEPAFHADQRGLGAKAKDWAKEQFGADPYSSPEDNTVSFTVGAVRRLLALEIERARR